MVLACPAFWLFSTSIHVVTLLPVVTNPLSALNQRRPSGAIPLTKGPVLSVKTALLGRFTFAKESTSLTNDWAEY
ncbi:hypothetical protein D3C80_928820 [compost metagenome]